jgi:hypothetical protein
MKLTWEDAVLASSTLAQGSWLPLRSGAFWMPASPAELSSFPVLSRPRPVSAAYDLAVLEFAGRPSGSGRAGAGAGIRSLLQAALHGPKEYFYAGAQDR